jgi:serine/threonine protein kinase
VMRFFEANRTGYMVMEFVEGKPLPDWIGPRRPLPQQTLQTLVVPLLDGLEVIHKANYLHRDIKPANIFMREDGSPLLLDFGSARELKGGNQELTAVVTPGYAPLEQYHTQGRQGAWSDLYAFGGVMYWMLTGNKPVEAAARVRQDIMVPAVKAAEGKGYSQEFLAAIDWALKPNDEERPQSVAEFKRRLAGLQSAASDRTVPASMLEKTVLAPQPQSGGMTGLTGVVLDREQVKRVEADMAKHVGPIAAVVVRNAAKKALSIPALAEAVAGEIADEKARAAFIKKFTSGETTTKPPAGATQKASDATSISQKFTAEVLQKAEAALAQYIGAIAKVVVKRAAAKARDQSELYLLIADEIKDPAERKSFIRKAISVSGKG